MQAQTPNARGERRPGEAAGVATPVQRKAGGLVQAAFLALALVMLVASAPASAQDFKNQCWHNDGDIALYDGERGASEPRCVSLNLGDYPALGNVNDKTSSVWLDDNVKALLCSEVNFRGACVIVRPSDLPPLKLRQVNAINLRDIPGIGDNTVSSMKVVNVRVADEELLGASEALASATSAASTEARIATPEEAPVRFPLATGQILQRGQRYYAPSDDHYLIFQEDGNLVVYDAAERYVWGVQSLTDRYGQIARVELQPDGNLTAYDANDGYIWSALTENPDPTARLELTQSGALHLVSDVRGVLWASDGNLVAVKPATRPVPPRAEPEPEPEPEPAPEREPAPAPAPEPAPEPEPVPEPAPEPEPAPAPEPEPEQPAAPAPPPPAPAVEQPAAPANTMQSRVVAAHNRWRQEDNVPPLQWSDELATYAREWANTLQRRGCAMEHRSPNDYGENLAWASGTQLMPEQAVKMWGQEKADYNYDANTCAEGAVCGHYTQVVWRTTRAVGCAVAHCGETEIWVCNYDPPGNWMGQKPY